MRSEVQSNEREAVVEAERREFELRDNDGKVMCRIQAEFRVIPGSPPTARLMEQVQLFAPDSETPIDLSTITGLPEVKMIVQDRPRGQQRYGYCDDFFDLGEVVLVPFPESALTIAGLLHEFGHASQKRELLFQKLNIGIIGIPVKPENTQMWVQLIRGLRKMRENSVLRHLDDESVMELEHLWNDYLSIQRRLLELRDEMKVVEADTQGRSSYHLLVDVTVPEVSKRIAERITEAKEELERMKIIEVKLSTQATENFNRFVERAMNQKKEILDEIYWVESLSERDASRRALLWLRMLKQKHGIDLLLDMEWTEQVKMDVESMAEYQLKEDPLVKKCLGGNITAADAVQLALQARRVGRSEVITKRKREESKRTSRVG